MKFVYCDVIRLKTTETLQTLIPVLRKNILLHALVGGHFAFWRGNSLLKFSSEVDS